MNLDLTRQEADDLYDTVQLFLEFWAGTLDIHHIRLDDPTTAHLKSVLDKIEHERLA